MEYQKIIKDRDLGLISTQLLEIFRLSTKSVLGVFYYPLRAQLRLKRFFSVKPYYRLRVLSYHDIEKKDEKKFEKQLLWIQKKWNIVDPINFEKLISGEEKLERDSLLLTFDDGTLSNYTVAKKILAKHQIKALFFIVSNYALIDNLEDSKKFAANNIMLTSVDKIPENFVNMRINHLKELISDGHSIGSHTLSHARLSTLNIKDIEIEINEGADLLEKELGISINHFAYPFGDINSINFKSSSVAIERFKNVYTGMRGENSLPLESSNIMRDSNDPNDSLWFTGVCLEGLVDSLYKNKIKSIVKPKKQKILFLYAEAMGYILATIREIAQENLDIYFVHWDDKKLTPFEITQIPNVTLIKRSELSTKDLLRFSRRIAPDVTYVSGWQDRGYLKIARNLIKHHHKVVVGFDDQWRVSKFKHRVGSILGSLGYFSRFYSHAWVSGPYQFEYARRLGFSKEKIIFDLLSADSNLFPNAYKSNSEDKKNKYPHKFVYVGRFEHVKGIDILLKAWASLGDKKKDWTLHCIGNGSQLNLISESEDVVISDFLQPQELINVVKDSGCFILPSRSEPWGVVIHEFAAAGLPLISSNAVGANTTFLIHGVNGFLFENESHEDLASAMIKIINLSDKKLEEFSSASNNLSDRISSKTSANNFLSLLSLEN
jgi:glycosyltransferase involved in cell wall biosynthesis